MSDNKASLSDTDEFDMPADAPPPAPWPQVEVDLASLSDKGHVRPNNEDHFLAVEFGRFLRCLQTNLPPQFAPQEHYERGYGLLVADGMGGEAAGEVASRLAITTLLDLVIQTPNWMLSQEEPDLDEVERRNAERLQKVSQKLAEAGERDPELTGMGTTLTLAISWGARLLIAHVGDSRAYLLRRRRLHRLTHDHTWAQDLADAGVITVGEAGQSRFRHALTRSLGQREPLEVEFRRAQLEEGDRLLLCSDGLTEMLDDETIAATLAAHAGSTEACQALVKHALARGGRDNVTVVLAGYSIIAP